MSNSDAIDFALKLAYEYVSTVDIELQDPDKFNEIERLSVRLFEKNTENACCGEIVTITGNLHVVQKMIIPIARPSMFYTLNACQ